MCPTEIIAFNDAIPEFKAIDTDVLGMYHARLKSFSLTSCFFRGPAVSTDSHFSHLAWAQTPRKQGGLGPDLKLPLVADKNMKISADYGVLIEEEGIALRGLFIIDPKGILR